ncbi:hypothetical protein [Mesorhizobium sp. WSM3626]|uniref:hypothetical protein n=1 Tax=Mesorhizobium sp. WSM3626 TaxID=1040987 RepID=UPI0009FF8A7A|nr:hypothetical protein [Mesorhizobium sp. WSM3626]
MHIQVGGVQFYVDPAGPQPDYSRFFRIDPIEKTGHPVGSAIGLTADPLLPLELDRRGMLPVDWRAMLRSGLFLSP